MDTKMQQSLTKMRDETDNYELRALLYCVQHYLHAQEHRLALSQMQLDGETWDKSNW